MHCQTCTKLLMCNVVINQLPNKFHGHFATPRICNFIDLLILWVRSFSVLFYCACWLSLDEFDCTCS